MKINEIKNRLKDSNLSRVSAHSGVEYWKIRQFMNGGDPRLSTVEKLEMYFKNNKGV